METIQYAGHKIPVKNEYDVIVAGAGISGFAAALTAAQAGAKTLLIERSGEIGGSASLAGVANFCTAGDDLNNNGALWGSILDRLICNHAIGEENGYMVKHNPQIHTVDYPFAPAMLSPVLLEMLCENNVDLLLHSVVTDVIKDMNSIRYAVVFNESLSSAVQGKVFVDATGDGVLSRLSGAKCLPVVDGEYDPIPPAFRVYLHKSERPCPVQADAEPCRYSVQVLPDETVVLKININSAQTLNADERNNTEIEIRRRVLASVRDFQEKNGTCYQLAGTPQNLGIRESIRIEGDYVLTCEDIKKSRKFDDAVAEGSFIIDTVHKHEVVPSFDIPFRSLLVKGLDNLMVAGRCFSAERAAMSAARIMKTCCRMGQACGAAAAAAINENRKIREIDITQISQMI